MNFKKLSLCFLVSLIALSCQKDVTDQVDRGKPQVKAQENAIFYETYIPQSEDAYTELRDGMVDVFDSSLASTTMEIQKAIWLHEGSLSTFFSDTSINDGDSVVTVSRSLSLPLTENRVVNGDLRGEFEQDYYSIKNELAGNLNLKYSSTDVEFDFISGNTLNLKVVTRYYLNGYFTVAQTPQIPPASIDRYGGADARCGSTSGGGAWRHVQSQARAALSSKGRVTLSNMVSYNSEPYHLVKYINGDYLFGQPNALHFPTPAAMLSCVTASMQDDFSQAIVNQIHNKWGVSIYMKGIRNLVVWRANTGATTANWWYYFTIGDYITRTNGDFLTPGLLGLTS